MAATKLSNQDRKDLDKFSKYLVYKCIQVIVQSRLGEKVRTQSKPFSTGSDWFNLVIRDIPEVQSETKKVFSPGALTADQYVCVEISLKTAEGETMILETWWLTMAETYDATARVSYTVYNRMGILLKSLFCTSRVTPAYRLSRTQGPETFVICYRVYLGEPQRNCLGQGYQTHKVGTVPTPAGTITLNVAYRTKMLISPHQSTKDLAVDLKDDHFKSDTSPKKINAPRPCQTRYREHRANSISSLGEDGTDCQENCDISFSSSPPEPALGGTTGVSPPRKQLQKKPMADTSKEPTKQDEIHQNGVIEKEKEISLSREQKLGAFAPPRDMEGTRPDNDDIPFSSLLPSDSIDSNANQHPTTTEEAGEGEDSMDAGLTNKNDLILENETNANDNMMGSGSNKSTTSQASGPEDFVMVELKTPFHAPDINSDLGKFYRDCQVAPSLSMFEEVDSVEETLDTITNQLSIFETDGHDFDDFVNSLQSSEG